MPQSVRSSPGRTAGLKTARSHAVCFGPRISNRSSKQLAFYGDSDRDDGRQRDAEVTRDHVQAAMVISALVAMVFAWRGRKSLQPGDVTSSTWLLAAAVILPSLGNAVGVLTDTRTIGYHPRTFERVVTLVGPAQAALTYASPALLAIAVVAFLRHAKGGAGVNGPAVFYLLAVAFAAIADKTPFTGSQWTFLGVLAAAMFAPSGRSARLGVAWGLVAYMVASGVAAAFRPEESLPLCTDPAVCGTAFIATGVADNGNAFGLLLALGVPYLLFGLPMYGLPVAMAAVAMVWLSSSDTGQIASTVLTICYLIARPDRDGNPRRAVLLPALATMGAAGVAVAVTQISLPSDTFNNRPPLWAIARGAIDEQLWFGNGPYAWQTLADKGVVFNAGRYSTHNQFLEFLFVGGLVGLGLGAAFIAALVARGGRPVWWFLLPPVVLSVTERPWAIGVIDWLSWSVPALILAVPALRKRQLRPTNRVEGGMPVVLAESPRV